MSKRSFLMGFLALFLVAGALTRPSYAADCGPLSGNSCGNIVPSIRCTDNKHCCTSTTLCVSNGYSSSTGASGTSGADNQAAIATTICDYVQGPDNNTCRTCIETGGGTWTALGCISTDPSKFIGKLLGIGTSIGGGIAFLLILFGGFQILTSAGNPEQLNAGRELISSAIAGLLLIIFSIFLLRLIGFTILGIPGFG